MPVRLGEERGKSDQPIGGDLEFAKVSLARVPRWVTRELIELTIRVWQPYYKALLSAEDALTMILTAGRLFGALSQGSGP